MAAQITRCLYGLRVVNLRTLSSLNKTFSTTARLNERYFTKKHEWISVNDKIGTVGISDFAQDALGDVVYVELPEKGQELSKGDTAGAIESVKAASDIYSPASGVVMETNAEVGNAPGIINKSPYEKGWLFKLELKNLDELKELMDEAAYEKFKSESSE